jgi:cell division protein FtsW
MGTTLVLAAIAFGLLFVAGTPLSRLAGLFCVAAAAAFVVGMAAPYRRARLLAFLDPWADPGNTGYQSIQALVGMGSGGLSGVGLGASRSKWGFLPNAHTDFIFAIVGEEIGLLGSLLLVVLFVAFAVLGVRAALRAPDRFGAHLAAGITIWVVGQAFLNVGTVIGLLPVTGVPLPFVSFGGSSIVVLMLAVGILANVVRQGRPFPRRATSPPPDLPLGRPGRAASRRHPEGRPSAALDGRRKEDRPRSHPSLGPLPDPANRAGRAHPAHRAGKAGWPPKTRGRR